jgi:hypothetical protein
MFGIFRHRAVTGSRVDDPFASGRHTTVTLAVKALTPVVLVPPCTPDRSDWGFMYWPSFSRVLGPSVHHVNEYMLAIFSCELVFAMFALHKFLPSWIVVIDFVLAEELITAIVGPKLDWQVLFVLTNFADVSTTRTANIRCAILSIPGSTEHGLNEKGLDVSHRSLPAFRKRASHSSDRHDEDSA